MATARNKVISGDYVGQSISGFFGEVKILDANLNINKQTVAQYEVLTEDRTKSASSAVLRAGAGALLLGPIGLAAGLSAKNKSVYRVAIAFKNGKRSLIEIDEKLYNKLIVALF